MVWVLSPPIEAGLRCFSVHSVPIITRLSPNFISEWARLPSASSISITRSNPNAASRNFKAALGSR